MIWHFFEVWALLLAAFVVGGLLGTLLYIALALSPFAEAQLDVADAVHDRLTAIGAYFGRWRTPAGYYGLHRDPPAYVRPMPGPEPRGEDDFDYADDDVEGGAYEPHPEALAGPEKWVEDVAEALHVADLPEDEGGEPSWSDHDPDWREGEADWEEESWPEEPEAITEAEAIGGAEPLPEAADEPVAEIPFEIASEPEDDLEQSVALEADGEPEVEIDVGVEEDVHAVDDDDGDEIVVETAEPATPDQVVLPDEAESPDESEPPEEMAMAADVVAEAPEVDKSEVEESPRDEPASALPPEVPLPEDLPSEPLPSAEASPTDLPSEPDASEPRAAAPIEAEGPADESEPEPEPSVESEPEPVVEPEPEPAVEPESETSPTETLTPQPEAEPAPASTVSSSEVQLPPPVPPPVPQPLPVRAREAELPAQRPLTLPGPRNGVPDNLQRIRGIGKKNEELLNSLGVYHFGQIAAWTPAEARWIARHMAFPERIERDDWVGQAISIATGGNPGPAKAAREDAAEAEEPSVAS